MPDAASTPRAADANLLCGMLTLQMNFVGRDALVAAMQAWVFDKARPLLKADRIAQLHACKGITDETRRQALALADGYMDDAGRVNQAARSVVRWRDAPTSLYASALDWAKTACRLAPDHGACLTTLGGAQYRVGRDADALATLGRAEALNWGDEAERATGLAFLAMAHQHLGHKLEAAAALAQLHQVMTTPGAQTEEARALRAEAEALIAP